MYSLLFVPAAVSAFVGHRRKGCYNGFEIAIISRNHLTMILSMGISKLNLLVILSLARGY